MVFIKDAIVWVNIFLLNCQNRLDRMGFISSKIPVVRPLDDTGDDDDSNRFLVLPNQTNF